jgi:hypothetical protein
VLLVGMYLEMTFLWEMTSGVVYYLTNKKKPPCGRACKVCGTLDKLDVVQIERSHS